MRNRLALLSGVLLLAACGGGGSGTSLQTAALSGTVYELNGQSQNLAGVQVTVLETGATDVTGADGRFNVGDVPPGMVTLRFGSTLRALALSGDGQGGTGGVDDNGGAGEIEDEIEDQENEDGDLEIHGISSGEQIDVNVALDSGKLTGFSRSGDERLHSDSHLVRSDLSPDPDVEGKVKIESRDDREKFSLEVEHIDAGATVEIFLDDPTTTDVGFQSIGTAVADLDGEAEYEKNTKDGDTLPLGVLKVEELVGFLIEVRTDTGDLLLTGEVPPLPPADPVPGEPKDKLGNGSAHLVAQVAGLEGQIQIRDHEDNGFQLKIKVEGLTAGTAVAFYIEDPASPGTFVRLGGAAADLEGEAQYRIDGAFPVGDSIDDLVGLDVEIRLDDGTGTVLMTGTVPDLVYVG